jgi:hypothetical protein
MLSSQAVHEERPGPHLGIRVHGLAVVFSCFLLKNGIAKKANPAEAGLGFAPTGASLMIASMSAVYKALENSRDSLIWSS